MLQTRSMSVLFLEDIMAFRPQPIQNDPLQELRDGLDRLETKLDQLQREFTEFRRQLLRELRDLQQEIAVPPDRR